MKFTKFLVLSFAVLFTFSLQAQEKSPATVPASAERVATPRPAKMTPEQRDAKRLEHLTETATTLGLDKAKTQQFITLNENYREQTRALRADNTQEREAMGQAMKELRQAHQADLEALLTPEQMEQLKATRQSSRAKRQGPKTRPEGVAPSRRARNSGGQF